MAHFFFHVRDGSDNLSRDTEGQDFDSLEEARREAINASRELVGERLLHGGSISGRQIEIVDEMQKVLAVVNTDDVLFHDGHYQTYSDDVTKSAPVAKPTAAKRPLE